jgi:acetyltransferase-like isoleucine patch superfamily enzyme
MQGENMSTERWKSWKAPRLKHLVPTKWGWCVAHPEGLTLGTYTDIGYGTYIQAECRVTIGEGAQVGGHCRIYSVDTEGDRRGPVVIGEGARIGAGTTILPGTVIRPGERIRAHAIVTSKFLYEPRYVKTARSVTSKTSRK